MTSSRSKIVFLSLVFFAACGGARQVPRPATPQGYEHVELRDVPPPDKSDINVEVEGQLGPVFTDEGCGGFLMFPCCRRRSRRSPMQQVDPCISRSPKERT